MKARLFIAALLLLPVLFGCNKDENYSENIVGDWYMFYYEEAYEDYANPDYNESGSESFSKESSEVFVTFNADGTHFYTDEDGIEDGRGTWLISGGRIYLTEEGETMVAVIEFSNDDQFYVSFSEEIDENGWNTTNHDEAVGIIRSKQGFRRM